MGEGSFLSRLLGRRAASPEEGVLAQVREGGGSFRRVVFTRNRRVMVSVGDAGETLRLNERFAEAPPEVLRAVGQAFSGKRGRRREAAREVVLGFLRQSPPAPAAPPAPRPRRVPPADRPHLARLQAEFDRVNDDFFGGALPRVPLHLSGRMRSRNGHFSPQPVEIVISRALCERAQAGESEQTLRHEMIHLWQHVQGEKPGHGRDFRRWAVRLGVHPRAVRRVSWKDE